MHTAHGYLRNMSPVDMVVETISVVEGVVVTAASDVVLVEPLPIKCRIMELGKHVKLNVWLRITKEKYSSFSDVNRIVS